MVKKYSTYQPWESFKIFDEDYNYEKSPTIFVDQIIKKVEEGIESTWTIERKEESRTALDRGKKILETKDEMDRYLSLYGVMHEAKLNGAFSTIADLTTINGNNIELIDYGCGQGIGSIVFCDYLTNHTNSEVIKISNIKLIEPSKIALDQAKYYFSHYFPGPNLLLIHKELEHLDDNDLSTNEQSIKFHIFSNILDIDKFSLLKLYKIINKNQRGTNYFICVSPDYQSTNHRLNEFLSYFKNSTDCHVISERKEKIDNTKNSGAPWTVYEKVFKVEVEMKKLPFDFPKLDGYSFRWDDILNGYFINVPNGELFYSEHYFNEKISDRSIEYFLENYTNDWTKVSTWRDFEKEELLNIEFKNINWRHDKLNMYGKTVYLPRYSAWYGDSDKPYTYSGLTLQPNPWNKGLLYIKNKIQEIAAVEFNSVLMNWYRDGEDYLGWHTDAEKELGKNPVIGSVNFGETRRFLLRRNDDNAQKIELPLKHGTLLIMSGELQHFWQHSVPKQKKVKHTRFNLTFRVINP
jgi:alkylated DNA repair dioxygenase AlkB